jgi:hypothetical protein
MSRHGFYQAKEYCLLFTVVTAMLVGNRFVAVTFCFNVAVPTSASLNVTYSFIYFHPRMITFSALICYSKMSAGFHWTTWRYSSADRTHQHCIFFSWSLRTYMKMIWTYDKMRRCELIWRKGLCAVIHRTEFHAVLQQQKIYFIPVSLLREEGRRTPHILG